MTMTGVFRKVDTVILRVRDLEQARAWYRDQLRTRELFHDKDDYKVVLTVGGDTSLTLWQLQPGEEPVPGQFQGSYPVLMSDDVRLAHRQLAERGVRVDNVQSGSSVLWFRFYDLDGNCIEVCEVFA